MTQSRLRPHKIRQPVVHVGHFCDTYIPFSPQWIKEYLSFIPLWVLSITWLRLRFGRKARSAVIESLDEIVTLYRFASRIYRCCQSTTKRPPPSLLNPRFLLVHLTDPHLNCLPSLHVMVVTWAGYSLVKRIRDYSEDEEEAVAYIRTHAKLITETTLYVKQHSVNCIPAALFAMKELYPGIEIHYGHNFIRSLFTETKPSISNQHSVTEYMISLYNDLNNKKELNPSLTTEEIILSFLHNYSQ